jgi:hypothetical protein
MTKKKKKVSMIASIGIIAILVIPTVLMHDPLRDTVKEAVDIPREIAVRDKKEKTQKRRLFPEGLTKRMPNEVR